MDRSSTIVCNVLQIASLLSLASLMSSAAATSTHPVSTGANPYKIEFVGEAGDIAIGGYDTVAYFEDGRAIEGKEQFELVYKNARWRFSSAENLEAFVEDPDSYLPQYGGFCTVCMVEQEGLFDANPKVWTIVDGKLYLNYDVRTRSRFRINRDTYIPWADRVWAKLTESEAIQEETTEEPLRQAATQQQPTPTGVTPSMRAASAPYKVAIFPLDSSRRWFSGDTIESEMSDKITSYLQSHGSLEGTYSYYALPSGTSAVKRGQVWLRGPTSGDPNLKTITETGNSLGVQAVTLAWYRPKRHGGAGGIDLEDSDFQLYVVDVELGKTYRADGKGRDLQAMMRQVFSDFIAGRQTPTYKVAILPLSTFEGGWYGDGSREKVQTEILAQVDESLKQDKNLTLHYSYYDKGDSKNIARGPLRIWTGSVSRPTPDETKIYEYAREMRVDAVVTFFFKGSQRRNFNLVDAWIRAYVFDGHLEKRYEEDGYGNDLEAMLDRALAHFIAGRTSASTE